MSFTHIAMLILSLLGFVALAIGMEKHAKHMLRFVPSPRWRRASRIVGWAFLAGALAIGVAGLQSGGVGISTWFGWMALAALALIFLLPNWPWQPPVKAAPERAARKAISADEEHSRPPRRWIGWSLLGLTVAVFVVAFLRVETKPLEREDAFHGKVGPWTFAFAEADRDGPELVHMNVPMKEFRVRFCETCDLDILRAYLKVNKPRALRASGMAFSGNRWERTAEIQLPSNLIAESELWLTVVGKDGTVYQTSWPMEAVSPATVAWFEEQGNAR